MRKYLLLLTAIFTGLLLAPVKITDACAPFGEYEPDLIRINMFRPGIAGGETDIMFRFTPHYTIGPSYADRDINVKEWEQYTKGKVPASAIYYIQYDVRPEVYLGAVGDMEAVVRNDSVSKNPLVVYLKKKDKELLKYLTYAKKCELATEVPDLWQENNPDKAEMERLIAEGEGLYAKAKRAFLKTRIGYQMVKLAFYKGEFQRSIQLYDRLINPLPLASDTRWWALHHKGIALYFLGHKGEANYYLSRVFDNTEAKKPRVFEFYTGGKPQLDSALMLAANNHEKAVLYTMDGMQYLGRSLDDMKSAYSMDPKLKELGIAMVREINKLEDWLLTPQYGFFGPQTYPTAMAGYDPAKENLEYYNVWVSAYTTGEQRFQNYKSDRQYLDQVAVFVRQVADVGQTSDPALWDLAAAHLAYMQRDVTAARRYLDAATRALRTRNPGYAGNPEFLKRQNEQFEVQLRTTSLLVTMAESDQMDAAFEQKVYKDIAWLKDHATNNKKLLRDLMGAMASRYMEKGDVGRAALALSRYNTETGFSPDHGYLYLYGFLYDNAKPKDYDTIIGILQKKDKTDFERFLTSVQESIVMEEHGDEEYYADYYSDQQRPEVYKLMDYKGMYYIRQDQLEEAYAVYAQIPDSIWLRDPYTPLLQVDPVFVNVNVPHYSDSTLTANKRLYVKRILDLKALVAKGGKDKAKYCFELGNAYYNMTWHGSAWLMYDYKWSMHEPYLWGDEVLRLTEDGKVYYGASRALPWYLEGIKAAGNPKMSALCAFMAGQCNEHMRAYEHAVRNYNKLHEEEYKAPENPYLATLTQSQGRIGRTYYTRIYESCVTYMEDMGR